MRVNGTRLHLLSGCAVLLTATILSAIPVRTVSAAQITERSLTLQAGATDGGSKPGGVVGHYFQFTVPSVGNASVGSIRFLYCTTASGPPSTPAACTTPAGLSTATATLDETGSAATGFTINTVTPGAPYIHRVAASVTAGAALKFKLAGVTNPDGTDCASENCTFFVRIATYASQDATGVPIDTGAVAAATATQIQLTGIMPESLIFCTGATVSVNAGGIPDCSTATTGNIDFNQLFSPTATAFATSQMAASTNALFGYSITVSGPTLTSGSNTIAPIGGTAATSTIGAAQFGLNLMANTTPAITGSAGVAPATNGTNYMGDPSTNFDAADSFAFTANTPNVIAASDSGTGTGAPSDAQIYTVSYIANVSGSQVAGTYTSTLTYICTATF